MRFLNLLMFSFWVVMSWSQAKDNAWLDTYEAGQKKAKEEKKDILISFMGSDWCEQCKILKPAVLTKGEFIEGVSPNFVLVELDFPQLNPELSKRNEPIRERYGVKGYPVLLAVDSEGRSYGAVRYQRAWKIKDYIDAVVALDGNKSIRDEAQVEFEQATDDETRVAALEKLLGAVPKTSIAKVYAEEFAQLRKHSKDQSPLVADIAKKEGIENLQNGLQALMAQRKYQEAVEYCETYLAQENLDTHEKQAGLTMKYFALMEVGNFEAAVETTKELVKVDPKSPIGRQASSLAQRAQAALAAADKPKPVSPEKPKKEGQMLDQEKGSDPKVAQTEKVAPQKKTKTSERHQKSLLTLEATHQALAVAEEALAKAEADLAKARTEHEKAHRLEATARLAAEQKAAQKAKKAEEAAVSAAEIAEFEKRAADLRKQADELRKKAEELRQATKE